jgi:hypothetical protein
MSLSIDEVVGLSVAEHVKDSRSKRSREQMHREDSPRIFILHRRGTGGKVQHVESLPVLLLPIDHTLVVLRAERGEQTLGLLAAVHHRPRLCACLSRRALSKYELPLLLLLILASRVRRGGGRGREVRKG